MGQIASCQYIGGSFRAQCALSLGGRKDNHGRKSLASLPTRHVPVHTGAVCASKRMVCPLSMWGWTRAYVRALPAQSSILEKCCFGLIPRLRGWETQKEREIYSPAVIVLLKTTSSHRVYLAHLSKPQRALCSKSHFSRADYSVCSINFSLHLSQEQPL